MSQRPTLDPLAPGTFRSLLPLLDELLVLIQSHATSVNPPSSVEASEAVAAKARELNAALETMRTAALDLPGGHHSTGQIESLTAMLGVEAERRRSVLRAFGEGSMVTVDAVATRGGMGEDSVMPTPVQET